MPAAPPPNALFGIAQKAAALADGVIVGLSCGKDSLAVLDVCARFFKRVEAYYYYTTPGLSFHEATLARCEARYGITVHRLPHPNLAHLLREGVFRVKTAHTARLPRLRLPDIEAEVRRRTGLEWIATGEKRHDSLQRVGRLNKCGGIDSKARRLFPLMWWSDSFVFRYLRRRRIPLSAEYAVLGHSYGGALGAASLAKILEHFPEDFARIEARFPFVRAEVLRHQWFGDHERKISTSKRPATGGTDEVPEVQGGDGPPQRDQLPPGESPHDRAEQPEEAGGFPSEEGATRNAGME